MSRVLPPDQQISRFKSQYLQLVPFKSLNYPDAEVLRSSAVQAELARTLFFIPAEILNTANTETGNKKLQPRPPKRYEVRVLKDLVRKLESAFTDVEEDVRSALNNIYFLDCLTQDLTIGLQKEINDALLSRLSLLLSGPLPTEADAVQERECVTYYVPLSSFSGQTRAREKREVSLFESPSLLSSAGTTGLRTWPAALHLGVFLCQSRLGQELITGKTILELGAGTGFLSILCNKLLGARKVVATDGSDLVVQALLENTALNDCQDLTSRGLKWGEPSSGRSDEYDTILGADVVS
jgi:hypothetical protein